MTLISGELFQARLSQADKLRGVHDFGSYWYDGPIAKANGEFECVLDRGGVLDFYECKYFDRPMTLAECQAEERHPQRGRGRRGVRLPRWL